MAVQHHESVQRGINPQEILDHAHDIATAEAKDHYAELGWWVSPPFLDDAVITAAERGAERIYRGESDHALPGGVTQFGWKQGDGDGLRKNDHTGLLVDDLRPLVTDPLLGAVAALLAGVDEIRLWHDQLLYKPSAQPGSVPPAVGWHTDRQYWRACTSENMLTAWVPFHDIRPEHGPVMFVDGSHRWEGAEGDFWNPDLDQVLARVAGSHEAHASVALVPRGGASFHNCRTLHGSGPNTSGQPRRAIAVHLQDGANEHSTALDADSKPWAHHVVDFGRRLPDGRTNFADPAICPRLWPPAGN